MQPGTASTLHVDANSIQRRLHPRAVAIDDDAESKEARRRMFQLELTKAIRDSMREDVALCHQQHGRSGQNAIGRFSIRDLPDQREKRSPAIVLDTHIEGEASGLVERAVEGLMLRAETDGKGIQAAVVHQACEEARRAPLRAAHRGNCFDPMHGVGRRLLGAGAPRRAGDLPCERERRLAAAAAAGEVGVHRRTLFS